MSVLSRLYNKLIFKKFKKLKKINKYHTQIGAKSNFANLLLTKSKGLNLKFSNYSFSPHNPLTNSDRSMRWICENYHAAFDYLDKKNINSLLEIGCGYGLSTWILKDIVKENIHGLDINQEAINSAGYLFNDVKYICSDYLKYFDENPNIKFDVIISCFGPAKKKDIGLILNHCDELIVVGYRAYTFENFIKWNHKKKGKQLSFSTTLIKKNNNKNSISIKYFKYYLTWFYFESIIHSIKHKYFIPL